MPALKKTHKHKRIKEKHNPTPNEKQKLHIQRVKSLKCLVSGKSPSTYHHVTGYANRMGRLPRDHELGVPLAPEYHLIQHGPKTSVEALGHRGFYKAYGIDLMEHAVRLREESILLGIL